MKSKEADLNSYLSCRLCNTNLTVTVNKTERLKLIKLKITIKKYYNTADTIWNKKKTNELIRTVSHLTQEKVEMNMQTRKQRTLPQITYIIQRFLYITNQTGAKLIINANK